MTAQKCMSMRIRRQDDYELNAIIAENAMIWFEVVECGSPAVEEFNSRPPMLWHFSSGDFCNERSTHTTFIMVTWLMEQAWSDKFVAELGKSNYVASGRKGWTIEHAWNVSQNLRKLVGKWDTRLVGRMYLWQNRSDIGRVLIDANAGLTDERNHHFLMPFLLSIPHQFRCPHTNSWCLPISLENSTSWGVHCHEKAACRRNSE